MMNSIRRAAAIVSLTLAAFAGAVVVPIAASRLEAGPAFADALAILTGGAALLALAARRRAVAHDTREHR